MMKRQSAILMASALLALLSLWLCNWLLSRLPGEMWLSVAAWLVEFKLMLALAVLLIYMLAGLVARGRQPNRAEWIILGAGLPLLTLLGTLQADGPMHAADWQFLLAAPLLSAGGLLAGASLAAVWQRRFAA